MNFKNRIIFVFGILLLFGVGLKKINDYDDFNPTVIVQVNKFSNKTDIELIKGTSITEEFRAKYDNLGIVSGLFSTYNKINDDYLQFSIKEKGKIDWYYSNKYKVDQFQNLKYFPFGFPEIKNSAGKIYQIQIESLGGKENNSVGIIRDDKPFLSKYSFSLSYLKKNIKVIPLFVSNKIRSIFGHIGVIGYLLILGIPIFLLYLSRFVDSGVFSKSMKTTSKVDRVYSKFFIFGLFVTNLLINWSIRLKAMAYGDDLTVWSFFDINRNNYFGFVFNTYANKFRPIIYSIFYSLFFFFGTRTYLFGIFNILFSLIIAITLFYLFFKISKNVFVSFCFCVAFIVSRFAYYNITQVLGTMEAVALLLSVFLLYLLWCYLNTKKSKYFWISLGVFFLLLLTHERFITLLLLYFVVFCISKINFKKILLFLASILPIVFIWGIKIFVLRIRPLDGTGGTDILKTFNISSLFEFFTSGWLYLFGINAGPACLNGIPSQTVPKNINIMILVGIFCILLILVLFILSVIKSKKNIAQNYLKNFTFFFTFIFSTLLAASVTIRLEMRWLYVPFVGLLFLLVYMISVIIKWNIFNKICIFLIILWLGMIIPVEMYYRTHYKNIYYWSTQTFGNVLYEETIKKYGDSFWGYNTYIVCKEKSTQKYFSCDDILNIDLFFEQYNKKQVSTNIRSIKNLSEIKNEMNNLVIVYEK